MAVNADLVAGGDSGGNDDYYGLGQAGGASEGGSADELGDLWGDGGDDEEQEQEQDRHAVGEAQQGGEQKREAASGAATSVVNDEALRIAARLNGLGFQQGHSETYSDESDAYQQGYAEGLAQGFTEALPASELLGRIRLEPVPPRALVKNLYEQVSSGQLDLEEELSSQVEQACTLSR